MIFAGVDLGSTTAKVVLLDQTIVAAVIGPTGAEHRRTANKVMEQALRQGGVSLDEVTYILATGYGRMNVPFADRQVTEISCHAKGIGWLFPAARTVIDIGGQDSKGIKLAGGRVADFVMNDKCAAGTGRFLEVIAEALGLRVDEIGPLSLRSHNKVRISSVCTVFAEQEVVSRLAEGVALEDILAGLHEAIANRIHAMVERIKIEKEVVVTGGGAKNVGLVRALEDKLGFKVLIPPEPQQTGAIGAALLARELTEQALKRGEPLKKAERRLEEVTFFA